MTPFRETVPPIRVNFVITEGGIGDYVCYLQSLRYVAETTPHVIGYVYVPNYFKEVADHVMKPYKHWVVNTRDKLTERVLRSRPLRSHHYEPINAMGAHSLDLGFIYYAGALPPPEWNYYPEFKGEGVSPVEGSYAVMTPGATNPNRAMPPETFNGIKDYLIGRGVTPVFLGTSKVGVRPVLYEEGYDFEGGLDLRDRTTLIQCLQILKNAEVVVGLDNGILHLAAMTGVNIVFGYTIAAPYHRRPRREKGVIFEVYPKKLKCTFCQSRMLFITQNFNNCRYDDFKCIEEIKDPSIWIEEVEKALFFSSALNADSPGHASGCGL